MIYLYAERHSPPLDRTTLCPKDGPPKGVTAVLIDTTDPMSPIQQATTRAELENVRLDVPRHGAFEIYRVGVTQAGIHEPVFKGCNPGTPEEINMLVESERHGRKRWEEGFKAPLDAVFQESLQSTGASNSPIIESLQAVAAQAFSSNQLDDVSKKLIIVSDMLQNTPILNHYRGSLDYEAWQESLGAGSPLAHLAGVEVKILYLTRPDTPQGGKHVLFWENYFEGHGANLVGVKRISP